MKKALILAVLAISAFLTFLLWPREAQFQGCTTADWVQQYASAKTVASRTESDEALYALRKFGTNAVPYLTTEVLIVREKSKFHRFMHDVRCLITRKRTRYLQPEELAMHQCHILDALQVPKDLIAEPIKSALQSSEKLKRQQALWVVGMARLETCVPELAHALSDPDQMIRVLAAQSLMMLGEKGAPAVPAIAAALETNAVPNGGGTLVYALGAIGKEAQPAIPVLESRLGAVERDHRIQAAVALLQIDPGHARAIEVVETSRTNTDLIMAGLRRTRRAELPPLIASVLETAARTTNTTSYPRALHILRQAAPEKAIAILNEHMAADEADHRRYWAAGSILRTDRRHAAAIGVLLKAADTPGAAWTAYAIGELGEADPAMKEVITYLEKKSADPNKATREAAESALKRIRIRALNQAEGWPDDGD